MKLTFEQWKAQVNAVIERLVGLSADDLPDIDYYNLWTVGVSPKAAAREAIKMDGLR